jgi:uncharacterized membrane protein YdjX (TVP38/TMEM64 family)
MSKQYGKPTVRLAISAVLLCVFSALLLVTYLAGKHVLLDRAATFYAFAANHAWLLLGLYVLRLPLFLPASLVIVLTGMICGPVMGEIVAVAGLTLGGTIEFLLVRVAAAPLSAWLSRVALLGQWRERIHHRPFHAVFLMRVCFVPFDAVNVVAALARARPVSFIAATALGVVPTSLPMVMSGASIDFEAWISSGRLWPDASIIHWPYIAVSLLLALLIAWHARGPGRRLPRGALVSAAECAGEAEQDRPAVAP